MNPMKCSKCEKEAVISFDKLPLCEDHAEEDGLPVVDIMSALRRFPQTEYLPEWVRETAAKAQDCIGDLELERSALREKMERYEAEKRKFVEENTKLREQIGSLTSKVIHRDDKIAALEPSLNAALRESADLKQQLDVALAQHDLISADMKRLSETLRELQETHVSRSEADRLSARLFESQKTVKLLAEVLRENQ